MPDVLNDPRQHLEYVGKILGNDMRSGAVISESDLREPEAGVVSALAELQSLEPLVALDECVFRELGTDYAAKPWELANFACWLPNKQTLSQVVMHEGRLVGFWVSSERVFGEAHVHRVAVDRQWRKAQIARRMFAAFWRAAASMPHIVRMTVEMGVANVVAQRLYRSLGCEYLDAVGTRDYLLARARDERTEGVEIVDESGARSIVMARQL